MSSPKSFKLSQLATLLGAELEGDPDKEIIGLIHWLELLTDEVSFLAREAYVPQLASSKAGAIICNSKTSKLFDGTKLFV